MNKIDCIFCEIPSEKIVIEENGYQGRQCPRCQLIYISPRPSRDEIIDLYGHDDAHIAAGDHIADEFRKRLYARHHITYLKQHISGGKLLEVGAGAGFFLDEARKQGFRPFGLEFNPIQAAYIRDRLGIPCEESSLKPTLFGGKKFDVVYHCDVISHLYHPLEDFRTIHSLMIDKGILLFETGNYGEMDPRYYPYIDTFMYPDHLFFFTADNLTTLLESSGFELIEIRRYSILPQLRLKKALQRLRKLTERDGRTAHPAERQPEEDLPIDNGSHAGKRTAAERALTALKVSVNFFVRYTIGSLLPKRARPQTLLIIARKKGGLQQTSTR